MGANDFEGRDPAAMGPLPVTQDRPIRCPRCSGDGGGMAHINRGLDISTHSFEWVECRTCEGLGAIDRERAAMIEEGQKWRNARVARGETLLEMSRRFGMSPADISAIEVGRAPSAAYDDFRTRLSH